MKKRVGFIIGAVAVLGFSPVFATVDPSLSNDVLQSFIADIEAGKSGNVERKIASVETDAPSVAKTPREFADRVSGCKAETVETDPGPLAWVRVEWSCKDGRLFSAFDLDYAKPYLTVVLLEDEKARAARRASPVSKVFPNFPPPPVPSTEQLAAQQALRQNAFDAFALFVVEGLSDGRKSALADISTVRIARRNPVHKVSIEETESFGFDALLSATAEMKKRLGSPTGYSCNPDDLIYQCKFTLTDPDARLYATVNAIDGKIKAIEYLYATKESVQKDMAGPK